jgi:hypothetical protein
LDSPTVSPDRPERTSLYLSLPSLVGWVSPAAIVLFLAVVTRNTFLWLCFGLGLALVLWLLFIGIRRIDLDEQGITCIPLFPLRRKQSFRWADLDSFFETTLWFGLNRRGRTAAVRAPILGDRPDRRMGTFQSSTLTLPAMLARSPISLAMTAKALLSLLNSYRS